MRWFVRKFFSRTNPEHRWINPGFCIGPYVPLYGFGLCVMYLIASLEGLGLIADPFWNKACLFVGMALCLTLIEYLAGILCLKVFKVRLWDYSHLWGNIQGIICPLFSAFWAAAGGVYYFGIHPRILGALEWLSRHLAFSFVVGFFYGIFLIDVIYSARLITKIREFARRNHVVVKNEALKSHIRNVQVRTKAKSHFFFPLHSERPLGEWMKELYGDLERYKAGKVRRKQK